MNKLPEISASELVLSAVFFLQQKNGVTASEITKFICDKRKCKASHVKAQVTKALDRAIKTGIFSRKRGLYRIENAFEEKSNMSLSKEKLTISLSNRGKAKNSKSALRQKKEYSDTRIKPLDIQSFQSAASEKAFHYNRFDSKGSKSGARSKRVLKNGTKKDVDDFEDEDFYEDDEDDDVDYFSDENYSKAKNTDGADAFRRKSLERNDSFDNEDHFKHQNKKQATASKAKKSFDESDNEERRDNYTNDWKGGNRQLKMTKKNGENMLRREYDFSDNTEDSEDEEDAKSEYSNEESDSDNNSVDLNQNDQEGNSSPEKTEQPRNERREKEECKTEEDQSQQEDNRQQQKEGNIQLEKRTSHQNNDDANLSKDNANLNFDSQEMKNETEGETKVPATSPRPSEVQLDIQPLHDNDSRSSQKQTTAKILRYPRKRIAAREKMKSERKLIKRRRCK